MVKGKVEICEINLSRFNSIQGIGQFSLHTKARFAALTEIIEREIELKFQHFIAQPIEEGDTLTFYAIPFYEKPIRFNELTDDKAELYREIKNETISAYKKALLSLESKGRLDDYEYLEKCLKYILDDFLYCYDNKVVLCVWGMKPKKNEHDNYGEYVLDVYQSSNNNIVYSIIFNSGSKGKVLGENQFIIKLEKGSILNINDIPSIIPNEGYIFEKWEDNDILLGQPLKKDTVINAIYTKGSENINEEEIVIIQDELIEEESSPIYHKVFFRILADDKNVEKEIVYEFEDGKILTENDVPHIENRKGYTFSDWDSNPMDKEVKHNLSFEGRYEKITRFPWYKRLWNWLVNFFKTNRFFKWLLWLLILILLILLLSWLLRGCNRVQPIPSPINKKPWLHSDPRVGDEGGVYDPGNPYATIPTPPEYDEFLPPQQGVILPIDKSKIIRRPGMPVIVGNRLNILLENEDKSILDLAKDFKNKYPDEKYKVVYYDNVVKRMQIEIPENEREKLKTEIPTKLASKYELFIFDESIFEGSYIPKDPAFNDKYKSQYLKTVNAPSAWDLTLGSPKITIAIVDNGFNLNHSELAKKVVMPYNVWSHSKDISSQEIDHGTHVAGTALAYANNNKGLCGIAPNCSFMPVQVANEEGQMTTTSILDGILYSLYQGADVINVSLGIEFSEHIPLDEQRELQNNHFKEEERLWNKVMEISNKHKATIVLAAGNENMLAGINPMNRPKSFIIVSAVDKSNNSYQKAGFSNYGDYSTISAPGVGIYSCVGDDEYETMDGTSMAAPIVTGAVALMKSLNKNLTSEQIICILRNSGKPLNGKVGNLIQINNALKVVKSGKINNCNDRPTTPSSGDVQILLSWDNYNDLDLVCTDPNNDVVWFRNRKVASGGKLEIDMNVNYPDNKNPIENIFWPIDKAPKGTYKISLIYYKKQIKIDETPYKIKVNYGNKIKEFSGKIKFKDNILHIGDFTIKK